VTGQPTAAFDVKPITDVAAWRALAPDWDRVLRATPGHAALQSFDFLATWWDWMAAGRRLWILAFYDGAELVGLAPLQIVARRLLGRRYRTVEFLGMTEEILVPTLLFPAARSRELHAALADYLAEHRSEWDLIELDELAAGNPLLDGLRELSRRCGLIHRERPFHDCPYIDLASETEESFWRKRSRKLMKNVRAAERKLAALGTLSVDSYTTPDEVARGYEELVLVERRSWKHEAAIGIASDAAYEQFYRSLLAVFALRHGARVMILKIDGRPIAGTMAIVFDGVYCSLQIVHDESYARFSPGTLLERYELEALLRERSVRRYELLGGALTNKLRWTSTVTATVCVRARAADARTRLLDLYEWRAKPAVKRCLRRLGLYPPVGSTASGRGAPPA
jgi:CelD/BcsL family acetyltransferase involved in cellulose biosynthesis